MSHGARKRVRTFRPRKGAVEPAECLRGRAHAETHGDKRRSRSTLPRPREDDGGGKQRSHSFHAYLVPRFPGETRMHQGLDGTHRQRGDTSHRSPDPPGAEPPPAAARLANGDGGAETQRPVKSPAAPRQLVLGGQAVHRGAYTGINDSDLRHFARASRWPIPGPEGVSGDQPLRRSHPNPSSIKQWLTRGKGLSSTEIAISAGMECDGENSRHPAHELAVVQPVGKLNATILTNRTNLCYANSVTQALLWAHGSWAP